jgi:activator of HSP90 ATPase
VFEASAEQLYHAWLDSTAHTNMTGGEAICSTQKGGSFSTWDKYITGKNQKLIPNKTIIQTWRTTEFKSSDEDSLLTLSFREKEGKVELTLSHKNIPAAQEPERYKKGWIDHYFIPMKEYFSSQNQ